MQELSKEMWFRMASCWKLGMIAAPLAILHSWQKLGGRLHP